jgi:hypothetical protein
LCTPDAHFRIPGILSANFLLLIGILNAHTTLRLQSKMQGLAHRNIRILLANTRTLGDSYWRCGEEEAFILGHGPIKQHKQIGIRRGATSFNMRTGFIKWNKNFNNWQELKGLSRIFSVCPSFFLQKT